MSQIPADTFCQLMLLEAEARADLLEFAGSTPVSPDLMMRLVDGAARAERIKNPASNCRPGSEFP